MTANFKTSQEYRLFEYACSLLAANKISEAIKEFESLHSQYPDEYRVVFMLGGAYFEADRFEEATPHFRAATLMRPKHKMSSLLLFHALWEQGHSDEAIIELDRFQAVAKSEDYVAIRRELEEKGIVSKLDFKGIAQPEAGGNDG